MQINRSATLLALGLVPLPGYVSQKGSTSPYMHTKPYLIV